jgi:hypothetical protein
MMHGTRAHPTQVTRALGEGDLSTMHTTNGFCFCSNPAECVVPKGKWGDASDSDATVDDSELCGLWHTISSLVDRKQRRAVDLNPNPCASQLDWPFVNGTLRDGTPTLGREKAAACNLYDRLPKFRYAYNSTLVASARGGNTTLGEGGSCHTGRAPRMPAVSFDHQLCHKIHSNTSHIAVRCKLSGGNTEDHELPRELSTPPDLMVTNLQRVRRTCRTEGCAAPPDQYRGVVKMEPEMSFGTPYRVSTSRLLAGEVRDLLCGGNLSASPACVDLLNVPEWSMSSFINHFFADPGQLVTHALNQTGAKRSFSDELLYRSRPSEDVLWGGDWVACNQSTQNCFGSITKEDFEGDNRVQMCMDTVIHESKEGNLGTTDIGFDLCNLNSQMAQLCDRINQYRAEVLAANCMVADGCTPGEYVYTPGMYISSNSDFVRGTVSNFYERYNHRLLNESQFFYTFASDDLVCPSDDLERELRYRNEAWKQVKN